MQNNIEPNTTITKEQLDTIINPQHVIFAANSFATEAVLDIFRQEERPVVTLLGSYKDENETSFLIEYSALQIVIDEGLIDDQESILLLGPQQGDNTRYAVFAYVDAEASLNAIESDSNEPRLVYAGKFRQVPAAVALESDGFSYDAQRLAYFGIV